MTQRDLSIISMVYEYEGCGIDHLRQKFFSAQSHAPCYRRIARLVRAGYLQTSRIPAPTGLGKAFISLGANARPLLRLLLTEDASLLRRVRAQAPGYIAHHLAVCDVHLALDLATAAAGVCALTGWLGEGALRKSPVRAQDPAIGRVLCAVPDAAFTLSLPNGSAAGFALELDRGTVPLERIKTQKLRVYLLGNKYPVLFVVPDTQRLLAIAKAAITEVGRLKANPTTIWLTTIQEITAKRVLSAPWVVAGHSHAVTLAGLAGATSDPDQTPMQSRFNQDRSGELGADLAEATMKERTVMAAKTGGQE